MGLEAFEKLSIQKKELILSKGIKEFSMKSYSKATMENITKKCGISKGILFHYFGSKKQFYLVCLETSLKRLLMETKYSEADDFYAILFEMMNCKLEVCKKYQDEMHMVNMASRETAEEVFAEKNELFKKNHRFIQKESMETLGRAVKTLNLKNMTQKKTEGLYLYIQAVINHYLTMYQQTPDQFFEDSERIKKEMKEYLDCMLVGICN